MNGFFDQLLDMFEKIYDEEFADSQNRQLYFIADTVVKLLNTYQPYLNNFYKK